MILYLGLAISECRGVEQMVARQAHNLKVTRFESRLRNQKRTNFCLPDESSFFVFLGVFEAKLRHTKENYVKSESERLKMLLQLYFMLENTKNASVLFVVLCANKERQKHCVVRDLNHKIYKAQKFST